MVLLRRGVGQLVVNGAMKRGKGMYRVMYMHSHVIREQYDALKVFPEFEEARADALSGRYTVSIPKVERVASIMQSNMGPASLMAIATEIELADQRSRAGDPRAALAGLDGKSFGPQGDAYMCLTRAVILLRGGDLDGALEAAERATSTCEAQSQADMDLSIFPACYGTLGVCRALVGDSDGSEEVLQMAARWSSDAVNVLVSMGNLGSLHWSAAVASGDDNTVRTERIKEALAYWSEGTSHAIEIVMQGSLTDGAGAAASLCGVSSDEGMVTKTNSSKQEGSGGDLSQLEEMLKSDAILAEAYASVLCSTAMAHKALGAGETASEALSAALKALEGHDGPVLGRVLAEMGRMYADNLQAVQAEGLFRSALDKLTSPRADGDIRFLCNEYEARQDYGKLLSQWDKREKDAEQQGSVAREVEAKLSEHFPDYDTTTVSTWLFY